MTSYGRDGTRGGEENLSLVLADLREFTTAADHLRRVLEIVGENAEAAYPHYLLGTLYIELNVPEKAAKEFASAVKLRRIIRKPT